MMIFTYPEVLFETHYLVCLEIRCVSSFVPIGLHTELKIFGFSINVFIEIKWKFPTIISPSFLLE